MPTRPAPAWQTTVTRLPADRRGVAVEVRVSPRRRKTSTAYWEGETIVVVLPARLAAGQRSAVVDELVGRLLTRRPNVRASDDELAERAQLLADRYVDGVRPASIRWVTNQHTRWGSCTLHSREVRISHRLKAAPGWVLDAVVVHELAHLLHAGHGPAFEAVVGRYPRSADADHFLAGYALGLQSASVGPE